MESIQKMNICCFCLVFACISMDVCHCQMTAGSEFEAYKAIFSRYDNNVRPVLDGKTLTTVVIDPQYFTVTGMDTAMEAVHINLDYKQMWNDEILRWNPADFGGVEAISVPESLLWLPDICLPTSYQSTPLIPLERRKARITYDGNVTIWNPQVILNYCHMNMNNFPYDSQTCTVNLSPWSLTINSVVVAAAPTALFVDTKATALFRGNTEWTMTYFSMANSNVTLTSGEQYSVTSMIFTVKRNSIYYLCTLIIPTFIITTLCLFGIFGPFSSSGDREEKVTLGLTTLLSIAVILSTVADSMPKSLQLPLVGIFVIGELGVCTIAVVIAVMIIFLHERMLLHHYPVPNWLMGILRCKMTSCADEQEKWRQQNNSPDIEKVHHVPVDKEASHSVRKTLDNIDDTLQMVRSLIEEQKREDRLHYQWITIIDRIDFILLFIFQLGNIGFSVAFLL